MIRQMPYLSWEPLFQCEINSILYCRDLYIQIILLNSALSVVFVERQCSNVEGSDISPI
jgi:hypothetical protein